MDQLEGEGLVLRPWCLGGSFDEALALVVGEVLAAASGDGLAVLDQRSFIVSEISRAKTTACRSPPPAQVQ